MGVRLIRIAMLLLGMKWGRIEFNHPSFHKRWNSKEIVPTMRITRLSKWKIENTPNATLTTSLCPTRATWAIEIISDMMPLPINLSECSFSLSRNFFPLLNLQIYYMLLDKGSLIWSVDGFLQFFEGDCFSREDLDVFLYVPFFPWVYFFWLDEVAML